MGVSDEWWALLTPNPQAHSVRISRKHRNPLCPYLNRSDQPARARVIRIHQRSDLVRLLPTCQRCIEAAPDPLAAEVKARGR